MDSHSPDLSKYAERITVIVRMAPQDMADDPKVMEATVARFEIGGDGGFVAFEAMQPAVMEWQQRDGFMGWSTVESRQRHLNFGASGADAEVLVTLLGAMATVPVTMATEAALRAVVNRLKARGSSELRLDDRAVDADQMAHALCMAADRRRGELTLVDFRADEEGARAVYDDRDGVHWEVRSTGNLFSISRLQTPSAPS